MANIDTGKIRQDIEDLKNKKQTLVLSLQNDVSAINAKRDEEFLRIGKMAFEMSTRGEDSMASLDASFVQIKEYDAQMQERNAKMTEISERYDEEIEMLEKLVPAQAPPQFCSNCGKACAEGDAFCMGCGFKLT